MAKPGSQPRTTHRHVRPASCYTHDMPDRVPLLLDTDIGTNVDDALALAYLLCQPRCELLGVTTVTGEPKCRAMLVDAVCQAAGRHDVPVHAGADTPLLLPPQQTTVPHACVLSRWPHRTAFPTNTAVEFLRRTIRARPGEVTLLAIGPLTNVALLFEADPEIPRLLRQFVMMGGVFADPDSGLEPLETNTRLDPHAADIVFRAQAAGHVCVGLNVTTRCRLTRRDCRRRFRGGVLDCVADMAEVWFRDRDHITFHDPLAAACIFAPNVCRFEAGVLSVVLKCYETIGAVQFRAEANGPHRITVAADPDHFFAEYFQAMPGPR